MLGCCWIKIYQLKFRKTTNTDPPTLARIGQFQTLAVHRPPASGRSKQKSRSKGVVRTRASGRAGARHDQGPGCPAVQATSGQTAGDEPARGQCGHPAKRRRPATRSQRGCGQGQGSPARCGRHQRPNEVSLSLSSVCPKHNRSSRLLTISSWSPQLQSPLTVRQNASRGKCQGSGAAGGWQQRRH